MNYSTPKYKSAIVGSNGYIGRHLSHYLKNHSFNNYDYDLQTKALYGQRNYSKLDLLNPNDLHQLAPDLDFIFLFAGLNGTHEGFNHYSSFLKTNELAILNLLNWMREMKSQARIIFPSTRLVYASKNKPIKEDDIKLPKTIYAVNKLAAEQLLWVYNNSFGIKYTIFRISLPYGDLFHKDYFKGHMGAFINRALEGKNINLYGKGKYRRTFTHIEDACNYMIYSIQKKESLNDIFNIGGESYSLFEIAKLIADHHHVKIEFSEWPEIDRRIESGHTVFNFDKISEIQKYRCKHSIKDLFDSKNNL